MWYPDEAAGFALACRTCTHLQRCLRDGHEWVQSPIAIGVLWCSRCQLADGVGIDSGVRMAR